MKIKFSLFFAPIFLLLFSLNCGKKNDQKVYKQFDTIESSSNNNQKDAISPEQGGNGFEKIAESLGWETNTNPKLIGDPQAIKGGSLTLKGDDDFPPTFRGVGQDTRHQILSLLESNVYEPLLSINYETMKYQPNLATHWKISDDKLTFWFRLNPDARWSDGREVTAHDVVATFNLLADKGHGDPNIYTLYGESFELPLIAESKYVSVPSPISLTNVPLYFLRSGFSIERFLSSKLSVFASFLDICSVYPAISVNIIAANFLSTLEDILFITVR